MPMKPLSDLHTHTVASGHAFSTLKENIESAREAGLDTLGISDHSPGMPGGPPMSFFENMKVIPPIVEKIRILRGMEANIIDYEGSIDGGRVMKFLDYVIASLHPPCLSPGTEEENTRAVVGAIKNPFVKIIGHPEDRRFPKNYEKIAEAAAAYGKALEINDSSLCPESSRTGTSKDMLELIRSAQKYGTFLITGSDTHICWDVGRLDTAQRILENSGFPQDHILNFWKNGLNKIIDLTDCTENTKIAEEVYSI